MSKVKQKVEIQKAKESDFDSLFRLIRALADYEKLQRPDDYAITFFTYSSFLALPK